MSTARELFGVAATDEPPATASGVLLWLCRRQWVRLAAGALFGVAWMLALALVPAAIGQAIDKGLVPHDLGQLLLWSGVVFGLGLWSAVFGNLRHVFAVLNWMTASFRGGFLSDRAVRRAGPAMARHQPNGEVVAVFSTDFGRIGMAFDTFARFCGALVSFTVVAVILLRGSLILGLITLIGGPVLMVSLALVIRPLQRRQAHQREETGALTALGTDTVAGLRVLRGVGGEDTFSRRYAVQSARVRDSGVRLAPVQASLDAAQVLLPGLFVLVVVTVGARLAVAGEITPGELVAYYGYTAFLTMPLRTATEFVEKGIASRISAGRIARLLVVEPDHVRSDDRVGAPLPTDGALHDPISGLTVSPGQWTALVSERPEDSAAIADRLGRIAPGRYGVTLGGNELDEAPLEDVRASIVVAQTDPMIFSGPVRRSLSAGRAVNDEDLLRAVRTASAEDAMESVDGGLEGELSERARELSGGQRQRLALTRALAIDPPVLVLVEPTSAVDAHTENRIATRLSQSRAGKTTVVASASPLLLDQADQVAFIHDGAVAAIGTHHDLVARHAAYARVVHRGEDD